jgi:SAM-dependent methyltransferase
MAAPMIPKRLLHWLTRRTVSPLVLEGPREFLARWFLRGTGIEIGALHFPLWVPPGTQVTYVDREEVDALKAHYPELLGKYELKAPDLIDDGELLQRFSPSSQDFIIANHFLEHTQDPVGTLQRHLEVVKPGGCLYMAVPEKRWMFDHSRPVTTLEHLWADHENGPERSYEQHLLEYAEHVHHCKGDEIPREAARLRAINYSIHYHVWTVEGLLEFLFAARKRYDLPLTLGAAVMNKERAEYIYVLQRE